MKSIIEAVKWYADNTPDMLCIADEERSYSYSELWKASLKAASVIKNEGLSQGDRVIVECTQDTGFVIADMACQILGAVFVPLEHKASPDRFNMIYEDTAASLFIYNQDYESMVHKLKYDQLLSEGESELTEYVMPEAGATAEILYTTGTTGKSKGIEVSHYNNVALGENIISGTEMKKGNIELLPLMLSHSHGIRCLYSNLLNGGATIIADGVMKVKLIFEMLDKYKVTAIDVSPSAAQILMRLSKGKLAEYNDKLDYVQIGTAPLTEDVKEALIKLLPDVRLYNFYGSTESGRTCALNFNGENRPNCIGKPTKNAHFIVTDDDRNEIVSSEDNPGLLASAGAMNMKGYYKQPELTGSIMRDGYVFTNDLGYIDADGYVYVLGRKDDVINYKGIKIAPDEIEAAAAKYPEITDCGCIGAADKTSGQVPKLFVSVKNNESFDKKVFYEFLKGCIDDNKLPKYIEVIDEIPRTSNGKLQRNKLREL